MEILAPQSWKYSGGVAWGLLPHPLPSAASPMNCGIEPFLVAAELPAQG